jgi:hypothetical protein
VLRAGLVVLMMVAGAIQPAQAGCANEDRNHAVLARQGIRLTEKGFPVTFPAMVRQLVGEDYGAGPAGNERFDSDGVEISVFAEEDGYRYPCSTPLVDITDPDSETGRIDALDFSWFQGFDAVTEQFGGSGSGFKHRIFARIGSKFVDVTPSQIGHNNMGGFFFGPLGNGRGNGFVIWEADWTDGAHYDPHPYSATFYEWDGSAFHKAGEISNPKKYEIPFPVPAPDFIGLPKGIHFDQTMPYVPAHLINRDGPS